jgi:hypothetical protein
MREEQVWTKIGFGTGSIYWITKAVEYVSLGFRRMVMAEDVWELPVMVIKDKEFDETN